MQAFSITPPSPTKKKTNRYMFNFIKNQLYYLLFILDWTVRNLILKNVEPANKIKATRNIEILCRLKYCVVP